MIRALLLLLLAALAVEANFRLYLKDGSHQMVREYQVQGDRVRYYSLDRSEWEEIPLELLDLDRTEKERKVRAEEARSVAQSDAEEEAAVRAMRREAASVPEPPGLYWVNGKQLAPIKQAETKLVGSKKQTMLRLITPVPIVPGKSTLEFPGLTAAANVGHDRPEFYLRLIEPERFAMVRLERKKDSRIVQKWTVVPVSKELFVEHVEVEIFRQQAGQDLYKIWPQSPLEPGEYAVIEYTEGKGNTQVWDFSYHPDSKAPAK